jgi:hypothetical protein
MDCAEHRAHCEESLEKELRIARRNVKAPWSRKRVYEQEYFVRTLVRVELREYDGLLGLRVVAAVRWTPGHLEIAHGGEIGQEGDLRPRLDSEQQALQIREIRDGSLAEETGRGGRREGEVM